MQHERMQTLGNKNCRRPFGGRIFHLRFNGDHLKENEQKIYILQRLQTFKKYPAILCTKGIGNKNKVP